MHDAAALGPETPVPSRAVEDVLMVGSENTNAARLQSGSLLSL